MPVKENQIKDAEAAIGDVVACIVGEELHGSNQYYLMVRKRLGEKTFRTLAEDKSVRGVKLLIDPWVQVTINPEVVAQPEDVLNDSSRQALAEEDFGFEITGPIERRSRSVFNAYISNEEWIKAA